MSDELKPCPFCGSKDTATFQNSESDSALCWYWFVSCGCGAEGSSNLSKEAAIAAWNTRAHLSSQPVSAVQPADENEIANIAATWFMKWQDEEGSKTPNECKAFLAGYFRGNFDRKVITMADAVDAKLRNVMEIKRTSDQSVEIVFLSCRAASAFYAAIAAQSTEGAKATEDHASVAAQPVKGE